MGIGNKVQVKGTIKQGKIIKTRLLHATETGRGKMGEVRMFTVKFDDGSEMEYEWTELRIVEY